MLPSSSNEAPNLMGLLDRAIVGHKEQLASLPEDRSRDSFQNVMLLKKLQTMDKVQKKGVIILRGCSEKFSA